MPLPVDETLQKAKLTAMEFGKALANAEENFDRF